MRVNREFIQFSLSSKRCSKGMELGNREKLIKTEECVEKVISTQFNLKSLNKQKKLMDENPPTVCEVQSCKTECKPECKTECKTECKPANQPIQLVVEEINVSEDNNSVAVTESNKKVKNNKKGKKNNKNNKKK